MKMQEVAGFCKEKIQTYFVANAIIARKQALKNTVVMSNLAMNKNVFILTLKVLSIVYS